MTQTKHDPFKSISENLPFWPDKENDNPGPFTGVLIDDTLILGEDPDATKNIPVFVFADIDTGEKFFIVQSYAIKKAVEKVEETEADISQIVFRFNFKGKTMAKGGKPFNQFDTAYCTIKEYEMLNTPETADPKPEKGKK